MILGSSRKIFGPMLAGLLLQLCPALAIDDVLQLADSKSFYETYLDGPIQQRGGAVVGVTVVGVRLDSGEPTFQPEQIRVPLGHGASRPESLCLRMLSRDGRYFARGQYRTSGMAADSPRLDFRSTYNSKLAAYQSGDVAVIFTAGSKTCDDRNAAQLFVAVVGSGRSGERLMVQVRAGGARIRAQLGLNDKAIGSAVLCEKGPGPTVGFSHECAIDLPKYLPTDNYQLSIGETGAAGSILVKTFTLFLARVS
ncbi:hypothetical protein [Rhodopseudomonas palustris]|uniref:hypothetical protein n=1 Tax=Rhodopseudomonas palustris TaxID=1076 RepID=UPI0021F33043|nr:hypothetical protein [Rhodopseudomonas palustris]UYO55605.1 hypothetical protein KQX61_09475 [Rhodopseudomonas palustris]